MTVLISHIARSSFVDGPGIRTTVFMKGCPLNCSWCHNPESISFFREQIRDSSSCSLCQECIDICMNDAISIDTSFHFDPGKCTLCKKCEQICPGDSLRVTGYALKPEQLAELLLRDKTYYEFSGGGVTFSGGEPLIHIDYLEPVMKTLKKEGIHVAIQTSGYFNFLHFNRTLDQYVDLIYYDLKIMDRQAHKTYTGKYNDLILSNLRKLATLKKNRIKVRTPINPGITNTTENLRAIKQFVKELSLNEVEFLAFNPAGRADNIALDPSNKMVIR